MTDSLGRVTRLAVNQPSRLPTPASNENGIRNFTDAVSQRQYRVWAWFLRNANASSAAMPANTVDCHKWLANAVVK
jgi:hypothetical protein